MSKPTLRSAIAKQILATHLIAKYNHKLAKVDRPPVDTIPAKKLLPSRPRDGDSLDGTPIQQSRVCIVGAGTAGLYMAMMLQFLGFTNVTILESSDRVGGRCYTYEFPEDPSCQHNYYDIGAMRIPQIDAMASTLNLIQNILKINDKLQPYVYHPSSLPEPNMYNYKSISGTDIGHAEVMQQFGALINKYITGLETDFTTGFNALMTPDSTSGFAPDDFSTRAWLTAKPRLWTYDDITLTETYDTSTGLFTQAFTETLCDYYDFDAAANAKWWRLEGGMAVVPQAMQTYLLSQDQPIPVSLNQKVTGMTDNGNTIGVSVGGTSTDYDVVFSTATLGAHQQMDLSGLGLSDKILTGIRTLAYDRATKVAIKFSENWWSKLIPDLRAGGVSQSDLPVSNVVYPSWPDDPLDAPTVLMVSYAWAQDATRIGSLVPDYVPNGTVEPQVTDEIVTVCLQSLAKLWSSVPGAPNFDQLKAMYITHHAFAWAHDSTSAGAFALFGPGQFKNVYPAFQTGQCDNKFWLCGEAVSAHHAWISGALDSAYVALMGWLMDQGAAADDLRVKLKESFYGTGEGEHVAEFDEHWVAAKVRMAQKDFDIGECL